MARTPIFTTLDSVNGALRSTENDALKRTDAERLSLVTPVNYAYAPNLSRRHGTVADGTTDDKAALARVDSVGDWSLQSGTHAVASNTTFSSRVTFEPGAILKPANGVTITLSKFPVASPSEQIFDLSAGGLIAWPTYDRHPVHAAWFGAIPAADATKSDQEVPINKAIVSLGSRGGVVQLAGGDYYCSNKITIIENTVLRGTGHQGTGIRVSSSWDDVDVALILFANGTSSQFGCRLEELNVDGSADAFVTDLIWAKSWNESCGFRDVWVRGWMKHGLYISDYYVGSATAELSGVQFFVDTSATDAAQVAIQLDDPGYTEGWFQFIVRHAVLAGNTTNGTTKFTGINATGRIKIIAQGIHCENALNVIVLDEEASCIGESVQAGGGAVVTNVFAVASTWTGKIHVTGARKGGATKLIDDNRGAPATLMTIGDTEPYSEPLIYPPDPARAIAGGYFVGTATPSITYAQGISAIARQAAGQFRFTLSPALGNLTLYDVAAQIYHTATLATRIVNNSGTTFDVFFTDMANAAADPDAIGIKVYHRAGGAAT